MVPGGTIRILVLNTTLWSLIIYHLENTLLMLDQFSQHKLCLISKAMVKKKCVFNHGAKGGEWEEQKKILRRAEKKVEKVFLQIIRC